MTKWRSKGLVVFLSVALVLGLSSVALAQSNKVQIKFFSNLPDRSAGQGKLEQTLIANYMAENPNVVIEVEALQDEPYKQKFKAYTAANQLPDIYMVWGQPAFFDPVMKEGYAAELRPSDYETYGFFAGSLDRFSYGGKLYGLARNTDVMVLYYNKALFEKHGIAVPTTFTELVEAARKFRQLGVIPCAINGKDQWILSILYQDIVLKLTGDQDLIYKAVDQEVKFAENPDLKKAAELFKELVDVGFFQDSFVAADYGAARNLFGQEQAAMYYMGSWEVGMATDENLPESFRGNVAVTYFPVVDGTRAKKTDYVAWNGGGYAVSSTSPVKDEAIKLLNYMMRPDNWARLAWQNGLSIPAQRYDVYMTGEETNLQLELTSIISAATSMSGVSFNDYATPSFKTDSERTTQEFAARITSVDEFLRALDRAAAKVGGK